MISDSELNNYGWFNVFQLSPDKAELDDAALSMERVVEGNPSNAGWRRGPRWRINFGVQTGVQLARFRRPISGLNGAESTFV